MTPRPRQIRYGPRTRSKGAFIGVLLYDDMVTAIANFIAYEAGRLADELLTVAHIPASEVPPEYVLANTVNDVLFGEGVEGEDAHMRMQVGEMRGTVAQSIKVRLGERYGKGGDKKN
ncbi:MAG TPA: hypothetical protein VIY48_14805, partial [Candidatus Paceibacterota bacterium]